MGGEHALDLLKLSEREHKYIQNYSSVGGEHAVTLKQINPQ